MLKTRHTFSYADKTIEIDIYPEWHGCAVLECDLTERGERFDLLLHAILLIKEPPCAAELELAAVRPLLEATHESCEHLVVLRIE